jgi:hypothetical protein
VEVGGWCVCMCVCVYVRVFECVSVCACLVFECFVIHESLSP